MSNTETQVRERLSEDGVRYTGARRAVVSQLARSGGPLSAAELHEEMGRSVPLSSLYRSLTVLEESGVLDPHHGAKGVTRYELAEWLTGHHHHLVCQECGNIEDIELDSPTEMELEGLVGRVSKMAGFKASGHSLELEGLCSRCS
jgi:Fe2+ or Zn2+ uptake regulation protein